MALGATNVTSRISGTRRVAREVGCVLSEFPPLLFCSRFVHYTNLRDVAGVERIVASCTSVILSRLLLHRGVVKRRIGASDAVNVESAARSAV